MTIVSKIAAASLCVAASVIGHAQSAGTCAEPPAIAFKPGQALVIDSRSAGVDIVGSLREGIYLSCEVDNPADMPAIRIAVSQQNGATKLTLQGGPPNNVRIRIEVPQRTDLSFQAIAGKCTIQHVDGNKDIHLRFGKIVFTSITPDKYGYVSASVLAGAVHLPISTTSRRDFFQSFQQNGEPGRFTLRASVTSGDVTFE